MKATSSPDHGFTLVEVLVSLAIMAFIATSLIASLQLGGRSWQRVTKGAATAETIALAQSLVRSRLEAMQPRSQFSETLPTVVSNEERLLEFSAPSPHSTMDGLLRYQIRKTGAQPANLELRWRRDGSGLAFTPESTWASEIIVPSIRDFSVQIWQPPSAGRQGHWISHWDDQKVLPVLIRIDVSFADNDPRRWPPLYVEPRVNASAACEFDVISRRCRNSL